MGRPEQSRLRDRNLLCPRILVALVAPALGIVAEHAFLLAEVPAVQGFLVLNPPSFRRRVIFRNRRAAGHFDSQRPLPVQFGLLDLLAPQTDRNQKNKTR